MSERIHETRHEQQPTGPEIAPKAPEAAAYTERDRAEHIKHAEQIVATETSRAEHSTGPQLPPTDDRPYLVDSTTKMLRMKQNLTEVQKRLKPSQKRLSKAIHQPLVRRVSESAGKTVSRPSGLLGGGVLAFVGSVAYLFLTSHYGIAYNYGVFLAFFAVGFIVGIACEYALHGARRLAAARQ